MAKQIKQEKIFVCPECQGAGLVMDKKCKGCQGLGVALLLDKVIYYWGKKISYLQIMQERYVRKIRIVINSLMFILGLIGFLSLMKVFYDLEMAGQPLYNFYLIKNDFSLMWWLSLLIDMYLVYRLSRESKIKFLVKEKSMFKIATEDQQVAIDWPKIGEYRRVDVSKSFDVQTRKIIEDSWLLADKLKHIEWGNIHMFVSLVSDTNVNMVFARLEVDYKKMSVKIKHALARITASGRPEMGVKIKKMFLAAYLQAYNQGKNKVTSTDLLYAVAHEEGIVQEILYDIALGEKEISNVVAWVDLQKWLIRRWHEFKYQAQLKPKKTMNRTYTAIATPNLDAMSRDMTLWARSGGYAPVVGREKELADIFRILEVDRLGAVLVGHPGVGKKTIIEGVAQSMVREDLPKIFQDKRLVSLSISGLIAGAGQVGELENRVIKVMNEIGRSKNIILFIEDIHHLVGVTAQTGESMDVAEVLAEQMQKNNFLVLATTSPEYYKQYIERSSLSKVLQKLIVTEPDEDEAIRILEAKTLHIEAKNSVYFSYQSLAQAVSLSKQYLHDNYLPDKAIKILEEVALSVRNKRGEKATINSEDVAEVIAQATNIPVTKIAEDESKKLLNLEERMHERIIGQDEAVKLVASALRRARTELRKKNKPIASFLFLGPTGVGKTEVAKTLARVYFGSEENMIRVDMSEYQGSDALAKLIGDARAHKGGYLTEKVRRSPFALILLDEVEKALSDILNVFLQVLDDGRLTDATGKTIDFTNTIIIGTSNAGTEIIQERIKEGRELGAIREELIDKHLKSYFRPELLNRFDGIVVFHPLEMEQVVAIAGIFLKQLGVQLEEKGIGFEVDADAIKELAQLGFDPTMGARPLRRVIQDKVEDQLAKLFLEKKIDRRDKVILGKGLEIKVEKAIEI